MIRRVKRVGAGLLFALLGFASLIVADEVGQLLCAHLIGCRGHGSCPIDVCEGDASLNLLRIAVWFGPALVFGTSAFMFGSRQRSIAGWLVLLTALVITHALIMAAAR